MEQINLLVLDTTSSQLKIGLSCGGVQSFLDVENKFRHVENVVPSIDDLFKKTGQSKKNLEMIGVCTGPGSFTGIRIGVSVAQGIAFAGGITCFGLSCFDVYQYLRRESDELTVPVIDARKERFYCAFLEKEQPYEMHDISARELVEKAAEYAARGYKKINFAGQDCGLVRQEIIDTLAGKTTFEFIYEQGYTSGDLLACAEYHKKYKTLKEPDPIYLRKSEAELALTAR